MQEKNNHNNSNSLGICQKLFNLFIDSLLARSVKRITIGQQTNIKGEMMTVHIQDNENSSDDLGSEIQVQFKQFEDNFGDQSQMHKAHRIPDQVRSNRDKATEKGKKVSEQQPPGRKKEIPQVQEKIDQPPQLQGKSSSNLTAAARSRGPNNMASVTIQDDDVIKTPRRLRPFLSVAPNINEKSDEFIKSRKEAMSRNLSMDTKTS